MIRTIYLNKIIFLGIVIAVWLAGHYGGWWDLLEPRRVSPAVEQPATAKPDLEIHRNVLMGWRNHQKAWQIKAENIRQTTDGNLVYFEKISEGIIYAVEGRRVHFTAGWARWEKLRSELYFGNGLTISFQDGTLTTPEAVLNYQTQVARSEKGIRFRGAELSISAQKMQADINKEELLLEGDVTLEQQGDRLRAQGLFYSLKENRYELQEPREVTLHL